MKNFTKQFANKALFKPTRWLLVALMFLLGTASAWAYNQSAVDLYFDDSEAKWSDNSKSPYVYIGHSTWTACYGPFTRVSGTQYLFKLAKANFNNGGTWNGASAWVICNEKWWDTSGESIDKFTWHGDKNVTQKRTTAWSASYIYKTNGTASTTSDNHTIQAYKTTTVSNSNYTVTINSATGGTLTVKDFDNNAVSNGASKIYLTVLKFSASTSSGYTLKEVQINDGSTTTTIAAANLGSTTYTLKSAVTITPVWEQSCTNPTISNIVIDNASVCSGSNAKITVTATGATSYQLYTVSGSTYTKSGNAQASNVFTVSAAGTYAVKALNGTCESGYSATKTLTVLNPTISNIVIDKASVCSGSNAKITVTATGATSYQLYTVNGSTYTKSGNAQASNVFTVSAAGTYAVKALNGTCESGYSTTKTLTVLNPTISNIVIDKASVCPGSSAKITVTATGATSYQLYTVNGSTYTKSGNAQASNVFTVSTAGTYAVKALNSTCESSYSANVTVTVNAVPSVSPSVTVDMICEGKTKTIEITTNAESIQWYKDGAAIDGETSAALDITEAGTYYAIVSNATGCSNQSINFVVDNAFGSDITPTISGTTSVQSGATGVEYSTAEVSGAKYEWNLPTGWTISSGKETSKITVTVPDTEGEGTVTVKITNNGCAKTATLDVAWMNGFTVYLRRPHAKNETTQYNYWFEKSTAAGPGYIKFGTVKASPSDSELYTYNGGSGAETPGVLGTKGTESFTDCDGYVWDAYNIGIDVTALYFHAPNDKSTNGSIYGGYATYTRSYSQNTPISSDLYFTMGNWTSGRGRTLTKVEKPFEGIEIDALGSTEICNNNMASFAALYLKSNCTGKEIKTYAWKYSNNNSSWGEYNTGKGATTNNIRPNKAGYYHLECTMNDGSVETSNSIQIKTTTCSISNESLNNITSNLPIIMVNTGNNNNKFPSVSNGKHCSASADDLKKKRSVDVKIIWNPNGTVNSTDAYSNGANLYYDRKARMNYRGSSSLNFEKKSFAFCPGDENCGQDDDKSADYVKTKKMNMFGIGEAEDKDWVLYAAYVDPSMMRNILAMETYSAMTGKWGVKNKYVELYIDGEYQGVYVFMDKVTQNKKRVNIKWDVKDDTKRDFILKFDKTDVADRYEDASGDQKTFESDMTGKTGISTYDTEVDQRFEIEYPEKEDIMDDGGYWSDVYSFVLGKVNEFESALSKGDFTTVRNLINYESWADFFILNEFSKNVDAYRASCIFVYTGGKFEAWPLWDYELSFNNTVTGSGKGRGETTGLLIEHSDVYSDEFPAPFWWTGKYNGSNMYSGLLKDPCFVQMIKTRWAEHTKAGGPLYPSTTTAKTAAYKTILDAQGAATREFTKWPVTSRGKDACNNVNTGYFQYGGGGTNTTYANSYSQLNIWLGADARIKGLQAEIDELDDIIEFGITSTVDKNATTPWRAVNVKVDAVGADYTYTVTPEIIEGQVIQGSDNLLIYAEPATLPQTYTVVTTLNAKDQCGGKDADNASSTVTFTVNDLVENCEE